ncbi:MAG: stage III sporulation protein AE [Gorillibacterium sp.]|nr:stage III sporulation protein AE [Gorillibacterium sp.]
MRTRMKPLLVMVILFALLSAGQAFAATPTNANIQQSNKLPTEGVEAYWDQLTRDYGGYFPDNTTPTFKEMMTSGGGFKFKNVLTALLRYFFHEIVVNGKLLATIVALSVFSMILETMQTAFEKQAVSKVAYSICYLVVMVLAVNSFDVGIGYAKYAIGNMVHFMMAIVPLLLSLLASMGNIASVTVLHPFIIFMIHTVSTLIYTIIFPLLFFSTLLSIVSSLSERYKVTQLAKLMRNTAIGILGLSVAVFLGVISVQGTVSSVTDGVTLRAAKYVAGNFIPVVGRMFTDASDTVIGASLLVKNTIGLAGVIVLILICAFPALKILALAIIYQLAAAVIQPLGGSPIGTCLQVIGKNMMYVFAALAAVGLMFFLAVTIMIAAGNVSLMMR